jgi:glycosyltransferase involved in cell wall biosynthesis
MSGVSSLSVVIPAYNAGANLKAAVDSLLAERLTGLEIVVVDDGSTDGSIAAIERLPVRLVRRKNAGEAAARNAGVRAASARFVTFLDADDLISPGGLAARLEYLEKNLDEKAVGGLPLRLIDERGKTIADVFEKMSNRLSFPLRLDAAFYRAGSFFPVSCSLYLYRREVFDEVGAYDESLPIAPDCDFHFRMLSRFAIPVLKIPTFIRRLHGGNLSLAVSGAKRLSFRPEVVAAVRAINRRYGLDPKDIVPWELDYL